MGFPPIFTALHNPVPTGFPLFVSLAEGLHLLIVDHYALERANIQPEGCVVQQQRRIDIDLDAGGKAHGSQNRSLRGFERNDREQRTDVDFLLALFGLFDDVDLAAV